jgi:hypothetical protein
MILRPNSRSCRTASIRSGIAGGLAGQVKAAQILELIALISTHRHARARRGHLSMSLVHRKAWIAGTSPDQVRGRS